MEARPIGPEDIEDALSQLRARGVRLAYWPMSAGDLDLRKAAERAGGLLVDEKRYYGRRCATTQVGKTTSGAAKVGRYRGGADESLEDLAIQSGAYSRFAVDSKIGRDRFEQLYRLWIRKSISGDLADAVLVAGSSSRPKGMITVRAENACGEIGLVAVASEEHGRGIGEQLVSVAQSWFEQEACDHVVVVTQGANEPACKLYEKCGFQCEKTEDFFHFWL